MLIRHRAMEDQAENDGTKEYVVSKAAEAKTKNCLLAEGVRCPDHFADVHVRVSG